MIGLLSCRSCFKRLKTKYRYVHPRPSQALHHAPKRNNAGSMRIFDDRNHERSGQGSYISCINWRGWSGRGLVRLTSARCSRKNAQIGHTSIIDLPTARVHRLQELIHLIVAHLLSKIRQDCEPQSALPLFLFHTHKSRRKHTVSKLAHTDEARHILIKHLKAPAIFFWLARVSKSTWSVQDFLEGVEIDCHSAKYHASAISLPYLHVLRFCCSLQSPPTPFSKSCISANVGFCPHARRRSPSDSRATRPLPRLSKRANASL